MLSLRPILRAAINELWYASRNAVASLISALTIAVRKTLSAIRIIVVEITRRIWNAILLSWKTIKEIHRFTAELIEGLIVFSFYILVIISPIIAAIYPHDDPFLTAYAGLFHPFKVVKIISIIVTSFISFSVAKHLWQFAHKSREEISKSGENDTIFLGRAIHWFANIASWSIYASVVVFILLSRLDLFNIDPINILHEKKVDIAHFLSQMEFPSRISTSDSISTDSNQATVTARNTASEDYWLANKKLSAFSSTRTYEWKGYANQGLNIHATIEARRIPQGLRVKVVSFGAEYIPKAMYNRLRDSDSFQGSIEFGARKKCDECRSFKKIMSRVKMTFRKGRIKIYTDPVEAVFTNSIIAKADEISISLIGSNKMVFLFPSKITL